MSIQPCKKCNSCYGRQVYRENIGGGAGLFLVFSEGELRADDMRAEVIHLC